MKVIVELPIEGELLRSGSASIAIMGTTGDYMSIEDILHIIGPSDTVNMQLLELTIEGVAIVEIESNTTWITALKNWITNKTINEVIVERDTARVALGYVPGIPFIFNQ